ncbi:MAG: hypothetical protein JWL99_2420 [Streptomyces oryziradicis]|nr:hypothetical protein [Actinacidiphila oryziradicis]
MCSNPGEADRVPPDAFPLGRSWTGPPGWWLALPGGSYRVRRCAATPRGRRSAVALALAAFAVAAHPVLFGQDPGGAEHGARPQSGDPPASPSRARPRGRPGRRCSTAPAAGSAAAAAARRARTGRSGGVRWWPAGRGRRRAQTEAEDAGAGVAAGVVAGTVVKRPEVLAGRRRRARARPTASTRSASRCEWPHVRRELKQTPRGPEASRLPGPSARVGDTGIEPVTPSV